MYQVSGTENGLPPTLFIHPLRKPVRLRNGDEEGVLSMKRVEKAEMVSVQMPTAIGLIT